MVCGLRPASRILLPVLEIVLHVLAGPLEVVFARSEQYSWIKATRCYSDKSNLELRICRKHGVSGVCVYYPPKICSRIRGDNLFVLNAASTFAFQVESVVEKDAKSPLVILDLMENNHGSWVEIELKVKRELTWGKCENALFNQICLNPAIRFHPDNSFEVMTSLMSEKQNYVLWFEASKRGNISLKVSFATELLRLRYKFWPSVKVEKYQESNDIFNQLFLVSEMKWKGNVSLKNHKPACLALPGKPQSVRIQHLEAGRYSYRP